LTVAAADRKALSRPQASAINRAQTILAGVFDVSVEYANEKAADNDETNAPARKP
jgi:hypothetical protein